MDKEQDRSRTFTRRAFIVGVAQGLGLAVLGGRLAWLQVAEGGRYKTLADNNRINTKMIAPSRGEIVDRFGVPLAVNNQNFRVLVVPEQTDDLEKALKNLAGLIEMEDSKVERILEQAKKSAAFVPLEVTDNLSWDQVARIEVNLPDLPGLSIDVGEIRDYPFAEATAHLVGYVGAVSQSDLTGDPVLTLPGFRIGKTGVEKSFDPYLRGTAGTAEMEVNVVGREVRELRRNTGGSGSRISLSIDAELQRYAQDRLAQARSASAVIMDAHTGAVYALVSHPGFDPNLFTRGIAVERWEELLADPAFPLTNKAIAGQYPPASTFKMVTGLAALEQKTADSSTIVHCPGYYEYGNDRFHCWKHSGHGYQSIIGALAESCDTYFYKISTEVGIDNIAAMARRLGLGQKYGFELAEERPGLVPDKDWKMGRFNKSWQPGETIVASIGQGYLQATPLQLAVMTARLVNGGKAVEPWLTGYIGHTLRKGDIEWPSLGLDPYHLELVKRGMNRAANHPDGTIYAAQIKETGMEMGGKTGTAQVRRITRAERAEGIRNEDLPWKYRHHALFVGYAPMDKPRYVCSVVVEHGGGGGAAAAPVARDLLLMAQKRDPAATPLSPPERVAAVSGWNGGQKGV